jgi:hypothetical protein
MYEYILHTWGQFNTNYFIFRNFEISKKKKKEDQNFNFNFLKDQRYYNIQVHAKRLAFFLFFSPFFQFSDVASMAVITKNI